MTELFSIKKHIQDVAGSDVNIIEGIGVEEGMDDEISVTVIATGFKVNKNIGPAKPISPKVYDLDKDEKTEEQSARLSSEEIKTVDSINQPQGTLNFNTEEESPLLNIKIEKEVVLMNFPKIFQLI